MATRYWVGGDGTWDASSTANWSATTGGASGASAPIAGDAVIFDSASGAGTCTTASGAIATTVTLNSATLALTLGADITIAASFTQTLGALSLTGNSGNWTLTTGIYASTSAANVIRSIAFGTGNIALTGNAATVWIVNNLAGWTYTGTPTINCTYAGATGTRRIAHGYQTGGAESNAVSFNITAGTDATTFAVDGSNYVKDLNFTGYSGTFTVGFTNFIYGSLTISSGMTVAGIRLVTLGATSGTQQITTNGKTLDFPITQNSPGATVQLQDNLTMGSTRTFTLTAGALNLNNLVLSTGIWNSTNSNVRSIAFGAGKIVLTQNAATIWNQSTSTNFSYTGTSRVECTYAGSTGTRALATARTANGGTETNSINFYIIAGSDIVSFSSTSYLAKTMDFTGFSGSFTPNGCFFYTDLVISSGMSLNSSATLGLGFIGSTPQSVTTAEKTFDFPLTFGTASLAPTVVFQDALTQGATRTCTFTNGTIKLKAGVTSTVGSFVATNSIRKYLQSTLAGNQATLSQASGTVNASYLTIQDINATGGAEWDAFTNQNNIDAGNNDGWDFGISPVVGGAEYTYSLRSFTQPRRF